MAIIWMENIKKHYSQGSVNVPVLKGIDLRINEGEYVSIMGVSGSGKSTLMNILGCLDRPTTGCYVFEGRNLNTYSDQELAYVRNQRIGFVFQQFNLLPRATALENVVVPMIYANVPKEKRLKRATRALIDVGLGQHLHKRPNQLSGGQQQRVAIARALVNQPALILADEPTGALDTETSTEVMGLFTTLNQQGKTIVLVTHNSEIAAQTQRIIRVQNGMIF